MEIPTLDLYFQFHSSLIVTMVMIPAGTWGHQNALKWIFLKPILPKYAYRSSITFYISFQLIISSTYNISKIKKLLELDNITLLVHAYITSKLHYCNALYYNCGGTCLHKLQSIQTQQLDQCLECLNSTHITKRRTQLATNRTENKLQDPCSYFQVHA